MENVFVSAEQQPCDLASLEIAQIQSLNQALWVWHEYTDRFQDPIQGEPSLQEQLLGNFRLAVEQSILEDTSRGAELLGTLASSSNCWDKRLAAECLPVFAPHDLTLARNMLVGLVEQVDEETFSRCCERIEPFLTDDDLLAMDSRIEQRRAELLAQRSQQQAAAMPGFRGRGLLGLSGLLGRSAA